MADLEVDVNILEGCENLSLGSITKPRSSMERSISSEYSSNGLSKTAFRSALHPNPHSSVQFPAINSDKPDFATMYAFVYSE